MADIYRWVLLLQAGGLFGFTLAFLHQRLHLFQYERSFFSLARLLFGIAFLGTVAYTAMDVSGRLGLPNLSWRVPLAQAIYIVGAMAISLYYLVEREELREAKTRPVRRFYDPPDHDFTPTRSAGGGPLDGDRKQD